MGRFLYSQCSHNPEFADATLQGAQIKQKSLAATSSAVWTRGALTLKISMIWTRYAADYPRSSCGCHQTSFLFGQGNKQGRLRHSSVCNPFFHWKRSPLRIMMNYVSVQGLLPPVILQGSRIKQKGLTATSSSSCSWGGLMIHNHWLYWFAHIYSSVLGLSRWEIMVERTVSYSFSLCVCSLKREPPDATLQGAQIKQKSLRATSSSLWPEGALVLNNAKHG